MNKPSICVVGGGPIGLFTAFALIDKYDVLLVDQLDKRATYPAAAAFWLPFASGTSAAEEEEFSIPTWKVYQELVANKFPGLFETRYVAMRCRGERQVFHHEPMNWMNRPEYANSLNYQTTGETWTELDDFHKPQDGVAGGRYAFTESWSIRTFSIFPDVFVPKFLRYVKSIGQGSFAIERPEQAVGYQAVKKAYRDFAAVVFCRGVRGWDEDSGPESRDDLERMKGVLARTNGPLDPSDCVRLVGDGPFSSHPVYVVPHEHGLAFGGTVVETSPDDPTAREISDTEKSQMISRVKKVFGPGRGDRYAALLGAPDTTWHVGLRPKRSSGPQVELVERLSDGRIILVNNGHGGSGFTFGYGAALRIKQILMDNIPVP